MNKQYLLLLSPIIKGNYNRMKSYQLAKELLGYKPLLTYSFDQSIKQSESYVDVLNNLILFQGDGEIKHRTKSGYIHRIGTRLKFYFSIDKNSSVLSSCLYEEELLLHHYDAILKLAKEVLYLPLIYRALLKQRHRVFCMHQKIVIYLENEKANKQRNAILLPSYEINLATRIQKINQH